MCFSSSPTAPVNTPDYSPEDAHKKFDDKVTSGDGTETKLDSSQPSTQTAPTYTATEGQIRM